MHHRAVLAFGLFISTCQSLTGSVRFLLIDCQSIVLGIKNKGQLIAVCISSGIDHIILNILISQSSLVYIGQFDFAAGGLVSENGLCLGNILITEHIILSVLLICDSKGTFVKADRTGYISGVFSLRRQRNTAFCILRVDSDGPYDTVIVGSLHHQDRAGSFGFLFCHGFRCRFFLRIIRECIHRECHGCRQNQC